MKFSSHIIVSTCLFASATSLMAGGELALNNKVALGYFGVLMGTVLPDIDHPQSTIGSRFKWLAYPIVILFGHRGVTHSLLAILTIAAAAILLDWPWFYWVALGYAGHLLGDYLTDSGIPLFWPSRKNHRFILVGKTGSISEYIVVALCVAATLWILRS